MRISVTKKDIAAGIKNRHDLCPIALAIKRKVKVEVSVTKDNVALKEGDDRWLVVLPAYSLPLEASSFISAFDAGKPVSPFEFELEGL